MNTYLKTIFNIGGHDSLSLSHFLQNLFISAWYAVGGAGVFFPYARV